MIKFKDLALLGGVFLMSSLFEVAVAEGRVVSLTLVYGYSHFADTRQTASTKKTYTYWPGVTRIELPDCTYFIDYRQMKLYRYDNDEQKCVMYTLDFVELYESTRDVEQSANQLVMREKARQLGSATVKPAKTSENVFNGYPVHDVRLVWGGAAMMKRTAVTPFVTQFGMKFLPEIRNYRVTSEIDGLDDLFYLAASYESIYTANPLLRRIDLLGVVKQLQGVPVMIANGGYKEILQDMSRSGEKDSVFVLPVSCKTAQ